MTDRSEPSLAEDEATLAGYASELLAALDQTLGGWLVRCVVTRWPDVDSDLLEEMSVDARPKIMAELRALLELDIAEQRTGPLDVLRNAVRFPTAVLATGGRAPVTRDEFAQRNFPDDVYDLAPASFAAVDPALHEPGLVWGAAKAHVHLRRRREQK